LKCQISSFVDFLADIIHDNVVHLFQFTSHVASIRSTLGRHELDVDDVRECFYIDRLTEDGLVLLTSWQRYDVDAVLTVAGKVAVIDIEIHSLGVFELMKVTVLLVEISSVDFVHQSLDIVVFDLVNLKNVHFFSEKWEEFSIFRKLDINDVSLLNWNFLHHSQSGLLLDQ